MTKQYEYKGPGVTSVGGDFAWIGREDVTFDEAMNAPIVKDCQAPQKLTSQKGCCACKTIKCAVPRKLAAVRAGEGTYLRPERRAHRSGPRGVGNYYTVQQRAAVRKDGPILEGGFA